MGGGIFLIFGVMFVVFAIASGAYNLYNAKAKKRFSTFDITENGEEPDPFNEQFSNDVKPNNQNKTGMFCPYCGTKFENDHAFCKNCGKKLQ
ncbi:MAG: zinc ribbon domain-containing protein, partial [Clostridia bacterium]